MLIFRNDEGFDALQRYEDAERRLNYFIKNNLNKSLIEDAKKTSEKRKKELNNLKLPELPESFKKYWDLLHEIEYEYIYRTPNLLRILLIDCGCCKHVNKESPAYPVEMYCEKFKKEMTENVVFCDEFNLDEEWPDCVHDKFGRDLSSFSDLFAELTKKIEIFLSYARAEACRQKVYWISRHKLSPAQLAAIHSIHGQQVEILHRTREFTSEKDFINAVKGHLNGFVYVVGTAPMYLSAMAAGLNFGIFQNHSAKRKDGTFGLAAVYHVENREIKKVWENPDPESDNGELLAPAS